MISVLILFLILLTGTVIGIFFFGGLWYTVQKGMTAKIPALWFLGSFVIRTSVTLLAIYYLTQGALPKLIACLAGFLVARLLVTRWSRYKKLNQLSEGWS